MLSQNITSYCDLADACFFFFFYCKLLKPSLWSLTQSRRLLSVLHSTDIQSINLISRRACRMWSWLIKRVFGLFMSFHFLFSSCFSFSGRPHTSHISCSGLLLKHSSNAQAPWASPFLEVFSSDFMGLNMFCSICLFPPLFASFFVKSVA